MRLDGYSGDDIMNICRDAAFNGMRQKTAGRSLEEIRKIPGSQLQVPVLMHDFDEAINRISPSVSKADLKKYAEWQKMYGSL